MPKDIEQTNQSIQRITLQRWQTEPGDTRAPQHVIAAESSMSQSVRHNLCETHLLASNSGVYGPLCSCACSALPHHPQQWVVSNGSISITTRSHDITGTTRCAWTGRKGLYWACAANFSQPGQCNSCGCRTVSCHNPLHWCFAVRRYFASNACARRASGGT